MSETIKEMAARWRAQGKRQTMSSCGGSAANAVFAQCARELEMARPSDLMCPVPELKGKVPLVLYFENAADADEFSEMVRAANPNFVSRKL